MITKESIWFVTGCSKGLGRALAEEVLKQSGRLVATARRADDLTDLQDAYGGRVLTLALDVTDAGQIAAAVAAAADRFGQIDVLVNNAGYGYLGAIEEGDEADVRALIETDLLAPVALTKRVLPGMRARRHGHIVNISSIGGLVSYPGVGYYNMVKAGLEAMTDALAKELAPLGIGATVVAPGAFRTDFRGGSLKLAPTEIADYADTAGKARANTQAGHGKQAGDPVKGAQAILAAVEAENPPVHFLIGGDALDQLRAKLDAMRAETDAWEKTTRGTDLVPSDPTPPSGPVSVSPPQSTDPSRP